MVKHTILLTIFCNLQVKLVKVKIVSLESKLSGVLKMSMLLSLGGSGIMHMFR